MLGLLCRAACLGTALSLATPASAQITVLESAVLRPGDLKPSENFASAIQLTEDMAILGVPRKDGSPGSTTGPGAVYVYEWDPSGWQRRQKLVSPAPSANAAFGSAVDRDADLLAVGEFRGDGTVAGSGVVHIYRLDQGQWQLVGQLYPDDSLSGDFFGWDVDMDGDVLAVGAKGVDDQDLSSGAVYVFRWDGTDWVQEQKLLASDGGFNYQFGTSVAVDGRRLLVGSIKQKVYSFEFDGARWVEDQILEVPAIVDFGADVDLQDDLAVIGAPWKIFPGPVGRAYVYRHDGIAWNQEQILKSASVTGIETSGGSVDLMGDVIVVGSDGDDPPGAPTGATGSASVWTWSGIEWIERVLCVASDGQAGDLLGSRVATDGVRVLAAARGVREYSGMVYVFPAPALP